MTHHYRPLEQLTLEEYEHVSEEYRLFKRCAHCGQRFRRAENVGQFQCRLHPGVMRYDMYRFGDYYSCCGGASDSAGCRPADHMDEALELEMEDETERHEQLFEHTFAVVPTGLYGYGLMPPQRDCTLWHSALQPQQRRSACFTTSFNPELEERFVFSEVAHEVSESVRDSPVLLRTLSGVPGTAPIGGRSEGLRRIEDGWPSELGVETNGEEKRRGNQRPDYQLPYVIVKCIG